MSFGRCTITSGNLNVRSAASTSSSILFTIKRDEVAAILSSTGNWYRINHPNGTGYVSKDYFSLVSAPLTTITVSTASSSGKLNIRSGPDAIYPVVFQAVNGTSLNMHEEGSSWTLVSYGDQVGWGSNQYLQYQGGSTPGDEAWDNSRYTYAQVKNGDGVFKSVDDGASRTYSEGVFTMQLRLVAIGSLNSIHNVTQGVYDHVTKNAIMNFQKTVNNLQEEPTVGPRTLTALDFAYDVNNRPYFLYGNYLEASEWGNDYIRANYALSWSNGRIFAVDALARVIHAEEHAKNKENSQTAVALTIKKRSVDGESSQKPGLCPNALIDAITAPGQYGTVSNSGGERGSARVPHRATYSSTYTSADQFLNPMWKNAVDLAKALYNNYSISAPNGAYQMNAKNRTSTAGSYTNQMYQVGYSKYCDWLDRGEPIRNAICFYSASDSAPDKYNVFFDLN